MLEKDGEDQLDRSCVKHEVLHRVNEKRSILHIVKRGKANWIGYILRGNCLIKHIIEGKIEGERENWRKDEEENVIRYLIALRKGEAVGNWKRKHSIAVFGELALEEVTELSRDRIWNEWHLKYS